MLRGKVAAPLSLPLVFGRLLIGRVASPGRGVVIELAEFAEQLLE